MYFDKDAIDPKEHWAIDWTITDKLKKDSPFAEWEVRNQARMHYIHDFEPYSSSEEGISNWVETATCIAVRKQGEKFEYLFCHGTDDLFTLTARPIDAFKTDELLPVFYGRVEKKKWQERWPSLQVIAD